MIVEKTIWNIETLHLPCCNARGGGCKYHDVRFRFCWKRDTHEASGFLVDFRPNGRLARINKNADGKLINN